MRFSCANELGAALLFYGSLRAGLQTYKFADLAPSPFSEQITVNI